MSFMRPSLAADERLGGLNSDSMASHQEGLPLTWHWGWARLNSHWITDVHNRYSREVGKKGQGGKNWYGHTMAAHCIGPIDQIDNYGHEGVIYNWDHTFTGASRYVDAPSFVRGLILDPDSRPAKWRVHVGAADAVSADRILSGSAISNEVHPAYRHICYSEFLSLFIGNNNKYRLPNVELGLGRKALLPDVFNSYSNGGNTGFPSTLWHREGINPINIVLEARTHPLFGKGETIDDFDILAWHTLAWELNDVKYAVSAKIDRHTELDDFCDDVLSYVDAKAFLNKEGKWSVYRNVDDGQPVDVGSLTTLSEHDFVGQPDIQVNGDDERIDEVTVQFTDSSYGEHKEDATETIVVPYHHLSTDPAPVPEVRRETLERPFLATRAAARSYGIKYLQTAGEAQIKGRGTVRRNRAVTPAGDALGIGGTFNLNVADHAYDLVCTVTGRRTRFNQRSPQLDFEQARGQFPGPELSDPDPAPDRTIPDVVQPHSAKLVMLPLQNVDYSQYAISCLVARQDEATSACRLWIRDASGALPNAFDLEVSTFALAVKLTEDVTDNEQDIDIETVIDPSLVDPDFYLLSQTDTEKANNELLFFINNEVMSVGTYTESAHGAGTISVFRGRWQTAITTHSTNDIGYVIPRQNLPFIQHSEIKAGNTVKVKVQPGNSTQFEDLADVNNLEPQIAIPVVAAPDGLSSQVFTAAKHTILRWGNFSGVANPLGLSIKRVVTKGFNPIIGAADFWELYGGSFVELFPMTQLTEVLYTGFRHVDLYEQDMKYRYVGGTSVSFSVNDDTFTVDSAGQISDGDRIYLWSNSAGVTGSPLVPSGTLWPTLWYARDVTGTGNQTFKLAETSGGAVVPIISLGMNPAVDRWAKRIAATAPVAGDTIYYRAQIIDAAGNKGSPAYTTVTV